MTIQEAYQYLLAQITSIYDAREAANIANWVIENITGFQKIDRITNRNFLLNTNQQNQLEQFTKELLSNKPVQYVLGEAWFDNHKFFVNENVLIPRPETEELVDWIATEINAKDPNNISIIDIGTGSGCIPISLKKRFPFAAVSALDVSEKALAVAQKNASNLEAEIDFIQFDFLDKNNWTALGKYDLIVSNPPYIKQSEEVEMNPNVLKYEPHLALFVPNNNALVFYEAIAEFGKKHLQSNGAVFVEINEALGSETSELFLKSGYNNVELRKDMQGKDRMIKAKLC